MNTPVDSVHFDRIRTMYKNGFAAGGQAASRGRGLPDQVNIKFRPAADCGGPDHRRPRSRGSSVSVQTAPEFGDHFTAAM